MDKFNFLNSGLSLVMIVASIFGSGFFIKYQLEELIKDTTEQSITQVTEKLIKTELSFAEFTYDDVNMELILINDRIRQYKTSNFPITEQLKIQEVIILERERELLIQQKKEIERKWLTK